MLFYRIDDACKGLREGNSEFCQHVAIQLYTLLPERAEKLTVRQTMFPDRRVYSGNPYSSEITSSLASVHVRILSCMSNGFVCSRIQYAPRHAVSLGSIQHFLMTAMCSKPSFDPHPYALISLEIFIRSLGETV